jgi:hypothetical protein
VYSSTGAALAVGGRHGIVLVSQRGGVIRALPVPGARTGCFPSRWWNARTILSNCNAGSGSRLWLVPAGGGAPTPLTSRPSRHSLAPYQIDAWRVHGHLNVQAITTGGDGRILRRSANGQLVPVRVPGTAGNNWIAAASRPRLLLSAANPCYGNVSLLWFNPVTRREHALIKTPRGLNGVLGAVPYGQPTAPVAVVVACAATARGIYPGWEHAKPRP